MLLLYGTDLNKADGLQAEHSWMLYMLQLVLKYLGKTMYGVGSSSPEVSNDVKKHYYMYSEVIWVIKLTLVMSAINVLSEICFKVLLRVKTWLCTTAQQGQLSS